MNKQEFLFQLGNQLSGLSPREKEEQLNFYREMIDDRMEDGLSEEDAIAAIGSVDIIAGQIVNELPPAESLHPKKRQWKIWEIMLLILSSPIWLSLLIVGLAVIFSLYISIWSVIVAFWAVSVSLSACALGCFAAGIILILYSDKLPGIAMIGAGLVCAGLSVFLFLGCKKVTSDVILLTKKASLYVKRCFCKKEVA